MTDFEAVGKQFVEHYYNVFDTDRNSLASLYSDGSMLTFEAEQFMGSEGIMAKLGALPSIKHQITTIDF